MLSLLFVSLTALLTPYYLYYEAQQFIPNNPLLDPYFKLSDLLVITTWYGMCMLGINQFDNPYLKIWLGLLTLAALFDAFYLYLPLGVVLDLLSVSLVATTPSLLTGSFDQTMLLVGVIIFLIISWRGAVLGSGDLIMILMIMVIFGLQTLFILTAACIIAIICHFRSTKEPLPFIPFLWVGTLIASFWY